MIKKELKEYLKELEGEGWTWDITPKKIKLRSPKGSLICIASTPSCAYFLKHVKGDVKRLMAREGSK